MKKVFFIIFSLVIILTGIHNTGEAAVTGNLVQVPEGQMISGNGEIAADISSNSGKVTGIVKLIEWLQVGGEMTSNENGETDFSPLAKILIINEYNYGLDLAAGLRDDDLYITAGKSFDYGITGHIGLGNNEMGGLFAGVSKVISPQDIQIRETSGDGNGTQNSAVTSIFPMKLSAEYYNESVNLGVRSNLNDKLYINAGFLGFETLTAGVSYSF